MEGRGHGEYGLSLTSSRVMVSKKVTKSESNARAGRTWIGVCT